MGKITNERIFFKSSSTHPKVLLFESHLFLFFSYNLSRSTGISVNIRENRKAHLFCHSNIHTYVNGKKYGNEWVNVVLILFLLVYFLSLLFSFIFGWNICFECSSSLAQLSSPCCNGTKNNKFLFFFHIFICVFIYFFFSHRSLRIFLFYLLFILAQFFLDLNSLTHAAKVLLFVFCFAVIYGFIFISFVYTPTLVLILIYFLLLFWFSCYSSLPYVTADIIKKMKREKKKNFYPDIYKLFRAYTIRWLFTFVTFSLAIKISPESVNPYQNKYYRQSFTQIQSKNKIITFPFIFFSYKHDSWTTVGCIN